jgi:anhydro-N-acetylmuramic acid kinase
MHSLSQLEKQQVGLRLSKYLIEEMSNYYIGIMSGTSMDGIDVALCDINDTNCSLLAFEEYPFPSALKEEILSLISGVVTLQRVGELHAQLGELFTEKVQQFLHTHQINAKEINAIGLHGQTLWHAPHAKHPFSMQLGDANKLVAKTGITTITDFRNADIAQGGEGAPFAPAFHKFLFGNTSSRVAVLNIGGMANLTILGEKIEGWDTGCGNVLLDANIENALGKSYDADGAFARSGNINAELLEKLLGDDYFAKMPPKSTGREYFNQSWLSGYLPIFSTIEAADMQRTLLELTAKSIANDLKRHKIDELIVCGGGAKNGFLMERLEMLCNCEVKRSEAYGVQSDALEAMAFAWFAYKRLKREAVELSSVTGAKTNSLLGAIYG